MSKLEKVIVPCDKKYVTTEELLLHCGGVYSISIPEKFEQPQKIQMGFLSVSISQDHKYLNFCLFKKDKNDKLERIQRFVLSQPAMKQLRSMMSE